MNLLEAYLSTTEQELVFRLASIHQEKSINDLLIERGAGSSNLNVVKNLLTRLRMSLTADETVDRAFQPRQDDLQPFPKTRFSDGTFGVYYSAVEVSTCKQEIQYHVNCEFKENGSEKIPFPRFYQLIQCQYYGDTVDLRGKEKDHSELVSKDNSGYTFCQALGLEAKNLKLDGFFTPSARNVGGTCVPVFTRTALAKPRIQKRLS